MIHLSKQYRLRSDAALLVTYTVVVDTSTGGKDGVLTGTREMSRGTVFPTRVHVRPVVSDQPAHQYNLIKVFAGHSVGSQGSKASSG